MDGGGLWLCTGRLFLSSPGFQVGGGGWGDNYYSSLTSSFSSTFTFLLSPNSLHLPLSPPYTIFPLLLDYSPFSTIFTFFYLLPTVLYYLSSLPSLSSRFFFSRLYTSHLLLTIPPLLCPLFTLPYYFPFSSPFT